MYRNDVGFVGVELVFVVEEYVLVFGLVDIVGIIGVLEIYLGVVNSVLWEVCLEIDIWDIDEVWWDKVVEGIWVLVEVIVKKWNVIFINFDIVN